MPGLSPTVPTATSDDATDPAPDPLSAVRHLLAPVCKDKHRQKLKEMKCSIDNAPPKRHSHLHKNLKKEQLMVRRGLALLDLAARREIGSHPHT